MGYSYRCYLVIDGKTLFTKKMKLDDALKFMHAMIANSWYAGIVNGELTLDDAIAIFSDVQEPIGGWNTQYAEK